MNEAQTKRGDEGEATSGADESGSSMVNSGMSAGGVGAVKRSDPEEAKTFAVGAARVLSDDRCEDIVVLDVRGACQVTDFIVIASGTSDRQMRSSADDVQELAAESGWESFRRSQDDRATWVVIDFVDVVVHVFEPNTRAFYDLEMLWGDAPRVDWKRKPGEEAADGSGGAAGGVRGRGESRNVRRAAEEQGAGDTDAGD